MDIFITELAYWSFFLFFNCSLFAFNYFINLKEASFLPFQTILEGGNRGIFVSINPDFFRFSIDISIVMILIRYGFLANGHTLIISYFAFMLVFNSYHYAFYKIYHVNPIIINDLRLLKNAVGYLWAESQIKFLLHLTLGILITVSTSLLFSFFLRQSYDLVPNNITHFFSICVLAVFCIALIRKGYHHRDEIKYRYIILALRILRHIIESRKLLKTKLNLNLELLRKARSFDIKLKSKPNIYLILIESYGSLLIRKEQLKKPYISKLNKFSSQLESKGWLCKSNLSSSPTHIGPSWLAYTTILFGKKICSNFEYEYLLNDERLYQSDTFLKVFKKNGYCSYNLNGSKPQVGVAVPFKQMTEFYGIDQWILNDDIKYSGTKYGFTKGPPDHYALNYAYENYLKNQSQPYIFFYLTKNSHSPFISPKEVPNNWKSWNETENCLVGNGFLQKPNLRDYTQAINHQLDTIEDFISKNGKDDDVFLFVGDHQPHGISSNSDGTETITHIISKNRGFLNEFEKYGFKDNLLDAQLPVKHEALYSMFLKEFVRTYGANNKILPNYEPNGLHF